MSLACLFEPLTIIFVSEVKRKLQRNGEKDQNHYE
jgi:hypothetical protein